MRTSKLPGTRVSTVLTVTAVLLALMGCAEPLVPADAASSDAPPPTPVPVSLPLDAVEFGLTAVTLSPDEAALAISRERAVEIAEREIGVVPEGAHAEAYLVRLTDPSTAGMVDRPVWLVCFSGLALPVSLVALTGQETTTDPGTMSYAYVYLDAQTGEFLSMWAHS